MFTQRPMVKVEVEINIKHPAKQTFEFIANPENNPKWQGGMKRCTLTNGELRLGSEYEQEAEFMGKEILTTFKIVEFEDGHLIKGESIVSTFPITFKRIVVGDETVSHVRAIVTGNPDGFLGLFPWFTRWMINRSITKDYQKLKELLES